MTARSSKRAAPPGQAPVCGGNPGVPSDEGECHPPSDVALAPLPQLVAQVYVASAPEQRVSVIAQLLRPLGALALVVVADGVFAKIRFRSGWQELSVRAEDLLEVRGEHVRALVHHVAQVSIEAVEGLAGLLDDTPAAGGSAAALLVALLVQQARARQRLAACPKARSAPP